MGGSMGGGASILAAAQFPGLLFLALKSPVIDFKEIEEYRAKSPGKYKEELNYGWNRDSGNFNGYNSLRKIRIPIMIVHGTKDEEVPTMFSKKAARLDPKIILHLVSGADHRYSNPKHFEEMLTTMSEFIISQSRR